MNSDDAFAREMTAKIVRAYLMSSPCPSSDLPALMQSVHDALRSVMRPDAFSNPPAVPIARSVTPDFIICLEDGQKLKSLKRHLSAKYGMTAEQYRKKWNLPTSYPMVAPNYSKARSALAKATGLGTSSPRPANGSHRNGAAKDQ